MLTNMHKGIYHGSFVDNSVSPATSVYHTVASNCHSVSNFYPECLLHPQPSFRLAQAEIIFVINPLRLL